MGYALGMRVVEHHRSEHDAWVVVDGKVYDITLFLDEHPGGRAVLIEHAGKDVTAIMRDHAVHVHSKFAYRLLEDYQIATLADGEKRVVDAGDAKKDDERSAALSQRELDALVDWRRPLLPQIGRMGDKYDAWVHSFPTTDHTVKMFQNDVLEFLTKCPWYLPLLFWIPIALLILAQYFSSVALDLPRFVATTAAGIIFWLLFEYSLHRWAFHAKSTSYWGNIVHFLIHGHHHITPMDDNRVVFPPVPALLFASPIWVGALRLFGYADGYAFLLGFLIGYLNYDMTHYWIHQRVPRSDYVRWHKTRHVYHHYHEPGCNYGISHPLFDYVFGTYVPIAAPGKTGLS
mmetsp:Transcript_14529/g.38869  ORF Transcript_14529/g.38869 Transcript_14529/m.38869 type:complete len:345 (-) Transcript_14529:1079-2113(-)